VSAAFLELADVTSTNSYLTQHREELAPYAGVYSWNQTSGRGRAGREWVAIPGHTLAFSLRLASNHVEDAGPWVSLLAGHVLCSVVRSRGLHLAGVKWPNDILVSGAKLAGILVEKHNEFYVVGIGINVLSSPTRLAGIATTSLANEGWTPDDVVQDIISPVFSELEALVQQPGPADRVRAQWRELVLTSLDTLGQEVEVSDAAGSVRRGFAVDLGEDGALVVDIPTEHTTMSIHAGDVFHIKRS